MQVSDSKRRLLEIILKRMARRCQFPPAESGCRADRVDQPFRACRSARLISNASAGTLITNRGKLASTLGISTLGIQSDKAMLTATGCRGSNRARFHQLPGSPEKPSPRGPRARVLAGAALAALFLAQVSSPALADTIEAALVRAYQNNPQLNAQRAQVRAIDEKYHKHWRAIVRRPRHRQRRISIYRWRGHRPVSEKNSTVPNRHAASASR